MMAQLYGNQWVSSYGVNPDPHGVWKATLRDVSREQIRKGFSRLVRTGKAWPPSAPEFLALCQPTPEEFGMPSLEEVTDRIISAVLSDNRVKVHLMSKPVYAVWRELGDTFNFRLSDETAMRKKVRLAYDKAFSNLSAGMELPEVPLPLPPKEHKAANRENSIARMAQLKSSLERGAI